MQITNFTAAHTESAARIAKQNYNEERQFVPELPFVDTLPDLTGFADGVAAVNGDELLGYFCWYAPFDNHFGNCKGTWSPIHAHGSVCQNRADIYDRLYQAAAERLVADGVFSHAVTLYEHDASANASFSFNGFGRRCIDAIRETIPIISPPCVGVTFREAMQSDAETIAEMSNATAIHLSGSPMFMPNFGGTVDEKQCFVAVIDNKPVAYYKIQQSAETFVSDDPSVMNITGAYCQPKFRGQGIAVSLLSFLMDHLRERGYTRCGVDFESFNYTGRKFWLKYFTAYTNSVVRRIDERGTRF